MDVEARQPAAQLNGLAQGVTANGVTLFVPMSIVAGSSNNVYALDNDTGYVVWQRHFDARAPGADGRVPRRHHGRRRRASSALDAAGAGARPADGGGGRGAQSAIAAWSASRAGRAARSARRAAPAPCGGAAPAAGAGAAGAPARRAAGPAGAAARRAPAPRRAAAARGQAARCGGGGRGADAGIPGAPAGGGPGGGLGRPSGVVYACRATACCTCSACRRARTSSGRRSSCRPTRAGPTPIAVNTTLYAATTGNCGGAPNAVWAIDLESEAKPVVSWKTNGGSVVGAVAFTHGRHAHRGDRSGPGDRRRQGRTRSSRSIRRRCRSRTGSRSRLAEFVTGPDDLPAQRRDIVAAATKDGRVLLLDAASLGGANHSTPLYASSTVVAAGGVDCRGALATWQEMTITPAPPLPRRRAAWHRRRRRPSTLGAALDPGAGRGTCRRGTSATNGAISAGAVVALKLADARGALSLEPAWTSHDLTAPATPIVVNGVVFALVDRPAASATGRRGRRRAARVRRRHRQGAVEQRRR